MRKAAAGAVALLICCSFHAGLVALVAGSIVGGSVVAGFGAAAVVAIAAAAVALSVYRRRRCRVCVDADPQALR